MTYAVCLFSTVAHEAAHAWTAKKFSDDTAADEGLITIDPLPHIKREPIGMVLLPLLGVLISGGILGWGSAPYDPVWAARYPRKKDLLALGGPMTNLLIALVSG